MNEMIQKFIERFKAPEVTPELLGSAFATRLNKDNPKELAEALNQLLDVKA